MKKATIAEDIAHDLRALGSIPFYFIVIIRAVIGQYLLFLWQLVIAAGGLLFLYHTSKGTDLRIASAIVLCVFTSLFYVEIYFTVFASAIVVMIIMASVYIRIDKRKILRGIISGAGCSLLAYLIAPLI
ncbi:MAG: hypothetical protein V1729_01925 [Candidatus Woesearchaeota archaeon]